MMVRTILCPMTRPQTRIPMIPALLVGVLINVGCDDADIDYQRRVAACQQVQLGDTEEVVRQLMGEPSRIDISCTDKSLQYFVPPIVPTGIEIVLGDTGRVEFVACSDSHYLKEKKQS